MDEIGAARSFAFHTRDDWHSEMAFDPSSAKFTILHTLKIPYRGGNACFANTEMVYEQLKAALQKRLIGLQANFTCGGRATNTANQLAANALRAADKAARVAVLCTAEDWITI